LLVMNTEVVRNGVYLSERAESSKNTPTDPGSVLSLSRRRNTNLHVLDGQSLDLAH
jgi:hypothetical protein